jgi:Fe-S cluster assembly iron-binding protein IscA
MMNITSRAAKMLKEKLTQIYVEAAGWDVIDISPETIKMLKEQLVKRCSKADIGFRILAARDEHGKRSLVIKVDRPGEGDAVLEADGIKVFVDPASLTGVAEHELDYVDEPDGKFVLR